MKRKWFHPLQEEFQTKIRDIYISVTNTRCTFQHVDKDRVTEMWSVYVNGSTKTFVVLVTFIKRAAGNHTMLIWETSFIGSN